jgi:hypothetical protein
MKFVITEWIKRGDISPLHWGDSLKQIQLLFPNSSDEIASLKGRGYPFIILDFVEFYFSNDKDFSDLEEIVIKAVSLYRGIITEFIDPDWLTCNLTFKIVSEKLNDMKVKWHVELGPYFNTANIRTATGMLFAFDADEENDNKGMLNKIFLHK